MSNGERAGDPVAIAHALQRVVLTFLNGDGSDVEPAIDGLNLVEIGTVVGNLASALVSARRALGDTDADIAQVFETLVADTITVEVERTVGEDRAD